MYLYIFEDGTLQQHQEPPTNEDYKSIENGILTVIQCTAPKYVEADGTRHDIEVCEYNKKTCHSPS